MLTPVDPQDPVGSKRRTGALAKEFQKRFQEKFGDLRCKPLLKAGIQATDATPVARDMALTNRCDVLIITAMEIRKLPKKLRALQAIEDSLTAISDEIGEEIYIRASDAKDRGVEVYTDMKEKGAEIAEKGEQIAEKRAESSLMRRSELLARRSELLQRREELLGQRNIVHERIAQAFPALREGKTNGPAFTRVHEHAQRRKQLAKALKAKARALKNKAKDRS